MGGYTFAREYNSNKINKWFSFVNIISVLMSTLFVVHVIILFLKYDLLLWRFERRWNCDNIIDWRRQGRTRTKKKGFICCHFCLFFVFFKVFFLVPLSPLSLPLRSIAWRTLTRPFTDNIYDLCANHTFCIVLIRRYFSNKTTQAQEES